MASRKAEQRKKTKTEKKLSQNVLLAVMKSQCIDNAMEHARRAGFNGAKCFAARDASITFHCLPLAFSAVDYEHFSQRQNSE